jgi:hypothetical protein
MRVCVRASARARVCVRMCYCAYLALEHLDLKALVRQRNLKRRQSLAVSCDRQNPVPCDRQSPATRAIGKARQPVQRAIVKARPSHAVGWGFSRACSPATWTSRLSPLSHWAASDVRSSLTSVSSCGETTHKKAKRPHFYTPIVLSTHPTVCLPVCLHLSIYTTLCLSVYLLVYRCVSICLAIERSLMIRPMITPR